MENHVFLAFYPNIGHTKSRNVYHVQKINIIIQNSSDANNAQHKLLFYQIMALNAQFALRTLFSRSRKKHALVLMLYVKAIMCTIKIKIFANALKTYHLAMVKNASLATYHNIGTMIIIYVNGALKTLSIILTRKNVSLALKIHQLLIN